MSSKQKKFKQTETSKRSPHAETTLSLKDPNFIRGGPKANDNDLLASSSGSAVESRSTTDQFDSKDNTVVQCATAVDDQNRDSGDTDDNNIRDKSALSNILDTSAISDLLDNIMDKINISDDTSNVTSQMDTSNNSTSSDINESSRDPDGACGPEHGSAADCSTVIGSDSMKVVGNTIMEYWDFELVRRRLNAREGAESEDKCRLEKQLCAQQQMMKNAKVHLEKQNEIMKRKISQLKHLCFQIQALKATSRVPEYVSEKNLTCSDNVQDTMKRYEGDMYTDMEMYKQIGQALKAYNLESQDTKSREDPHEQPRTDENQETSKDTSEEREEENE